MNETSKNNLTTFFREPGSLIIVDSSALSSDGTDSFFSYLSEIDDGDVREIGVVIPVKTFETLKKLIADKSQDYQIRKHASDSVMRIAELIGTNRIKVFGDDSDKMDENTVILTQLARLRTSYDILLLSDNLKLLRDADLINAFTSVDGKPIALASLDADGELILHEGLIRLDESEPAAQTEEELEQEIEEEFTEDFEEKILEEAARAAVAELALQEEAAAEAEPVAETAEEILTEEGTAEPVETVFAQEEANMEPEGEPSLESFFINTINLDTPVSTIPSAEESAEETVEETAEPVELSTIEETAETAAVEEETEPKIVDAHFASGWGEPISEIPQWNAAEIEVPTQYEPLRRETQVESPAETPSVPTGTIEVEPPERPEKAAKTEKSGYPSGGMFSFFKKFRKDNTSKEEKPADLPEVDLTLQSETPVEPEVSQQVAQEVEQAATPEITPEADIQTPAAPEAAPVVEAVETPAPIVEEAAPEQTEAQDVEDEDDSVEMVYCIHCGRKVPESETIEEVCQDCLNSVIGETKCIICGKPVPVLFRNRYIDQNENSLICEDCLNAGSETPAVIFSQDTDVQPEEPTVTEPASEEDERDMVVCIRCGKEVPAIDTVEEVCQECLEQIVDVKTCIGCGATFPITFRERFIDQTDDRLFCDNCMKESLERAESAAPVEAQSAEDVWADLGASFIEAEVAQTQEPVQAEEVKEEVQEVAPAVEPEAAQQTAPQPKLGQCRKCHKLVPEDELLEGYCQDCLNEVDHYTFCIECGTKIPVTVKDQYVDHAEQRFYCDSCMEKLGLNTPVEDETEDVQMVECAHCHQMVPADETESGYCQNCLNEVVDQGFCIECGARIPITFKEAYVDQSPRRLYCDNCDPNKPSDDGSKDNGPDLSGWSVL